MIEPLNRRLQRTALGAAAEREFQLLRRKEVPFGWEGVANRRLQLIGRLPYCSAL